ncbi:MAG: bifunctional diaminohydroxyphosphoribosylaminopyrimidine deaminase/5-amino-6-(5-phosphoribosylamino)uracil reductase RibD [candidate division KSB1 bacterium]|nr:bifunctional diaminohydroxyphosphoribosylaminopyrimidine deaminase/5-amino-6-(5-phosphoribosylamino)uracil reductase RibD [candidate division KSB1 bacterium]
MRSKGISVDVGILEEKCQELNKGYVKFIQTSLPFITLKIAQTLDGRIATSTGHSKWVTSEEARKAGHRLRARHDAVLVGIGTVLNDDPHLTLHETKGVLPRRIVLDSKLRVPLDSNVIADDLASRTIIVTSSQASKEKVQRIVERGSTVLVLNADDNGHIPQQVLWKELGELGITSVLVEGGSGVHTECLRTGNVDEVIIFIAPKLLGAGLDSVGDLGIRNMNQALELKNLKIKRLSSDIMISARYDTQKNEN